MSDCGINTTLDDKVLTLTFDRPEKKNAITADMYQALADGLVKASEDDTIHLVVIKGSDSAFCAGNDLKDFLENPPHSNDNPVWQFLFAIEACRKPIIAGVNGPAVGVGTTLLLHCDLVVASQSTVFALPFASLGLCPEAGSSLLLPRQCGAKKAAEWLMLGDRFDAKAAESAGLINRAVETADDVEATLSEWTQKLLKLPIESVIETRRLMRTPSESVRDHMEVEGDVFKRLINSDAAQAAFKAFLSKAK
ncbi:enoyl-CoA hydratase [Pleionea sediminis]|uniref:enoyl-CoA hydratase n=1 Tax=Pleionea sediminis TaxID=2569479 RepID=UPI0011850319|nr:enoyl-CoA hydratase [Pleionea sediminis]